MNILIWGAAGFIGTNLALRLLQNTMNLVTLVDCKSEYFNYEIFTKYDNVKFVVSDFLEQPKIEEILKGQDFVYHMMSTTIPLNSNRKISEELNLNIVGTSRVLEACVKCGVKQVVFISSGGTVYGKNVSCPIPENAETNPINSYGVQKLTIEKLLYLYYCMYNLDYRIIRLANPYGPYQRPNGMLGAVTTFTYKALCNDKITIFGDGTIVRDYIYIDDVVNAICNISSEKAKHKLYNVGSGTGTDIITLTETISKVLNCDLDIEFQSGRKVDVPENYLDVSRYETEFGTAATIPLKKGINLTADFLKKIYLEV